MPMPQLIVKHYQRKRQYDSQVTAILNAAGNSVT